MRFFTDAECRDWCAARQMRLDERRYPVRPDSERHHAVRDVPSEFARLTWFCQHVERSLQPREACLLWATDWGIWTENLHLYYRLRQSYHDFRLLEEGPGHLFLAHESADLVSFLQVGILCGWDMHLLPSVGYARAFVSHDEWVAFASDESNPRLVADFAEPLSAGNASPGTSGSA